jgi:acetyl esterase/lipase
MRTVTISLLLFVSAAASTQAQSLADWTSEVQNEYRVTANIVYSTATGYDNRLDIYVPRDGDGPWPTMIYIHGGGWVGGSKESSALRLLPYLRRGMAVVNVEYRLARNALAPAAVADCRCALRWVIANAERYRLDTSKIAVTGHSAGGHLALTTGMLSREDGFDYECDAGSPDLDLKVAAVVNWYGITMVGDLLEGENLKSYAVRWMGSLADRFKVAMRVSPLMLADRKGLPPILTIHGNADPTVPYQHAVKLREALNKAGVKNDFYTVKGGGHGGFSNAEMIKIDGLIEKFLGEAGVL